MLYISLRDTTSKLTYFHPNQPIPIFGTQLHIQLKLIELQLSFWGFCLIVKNKYKKFTILNIELNSNCEPNIMYTCIFAIKAQSKINSSHQKRLEVYADKAGVGWWLLKSLEFMSKIIQSQMGYLFWIGGTYLYPFFDPCLDFHLLFFSHHKETPFWVVCKKNVSNCFKNQDFLNNMKIISFPSKCMSFTKTYLYLFSFRFLILTKQIKF